MPDFLGWISRVAQASRLCHQCASEFISGKKICTNQCNLRMILFEVSVDGLVLWRAIGLLGWGERGKYLTRRREGAEGKAEFLDRMNRIFQDGGKGIISRGERRVGRLRLFYIIGCLFVRVLCHSPAKHRLEVCATFRESLGLLRLCAWSGMLSFVA